MSQLGGGIGTRGPGETQLETDRRKINLRLDHIKTQLDAVRRIRQSAAAAPRVGSSSRDRTRRLYQRRQKHPSSTLSPRLAVLESARMFATLDPQTPATAAFLPAVKSCFPIPSAFIRDLPTHSLRASAPPSKRSSALKFFYTFRTPPVLSAKSRKLRLKESWPSLESRPSPSSRS